jgi:hypothetical protein
MWYCWKSYRLDKNDPWAAEDIRYLPQRSGIE